MDDFSDKLTIGILDFCQEQESRRALEALKKNLEFKAHILFIDNGTPQGYSQKFLDEGLVDELVINKENSGCGPATVQMYDICKTPYLLYHQSDQELEVHFAAETLTRLLKMLEDGEYQCIDLAGNQGGGNFSERANIMNVDFYRHIPKGTLGGPGITNAEKYVEQWVQEYFKDNGFKIWHGYAFADRGYYSVRQLGKDDPCILKHHCWTKEMWVLTEPPKKKYEVYPNLTEDEWIDMLLGQWPRWEDGARGRIPEEDKPNSFTNPQIEAMIERDLNG